MMSLIEDGASSMHMPTDFVQIAGFVGPEHEDLQKCRNAALERCHENIRAAGLYTRAEMHHISADYQYSLSVCA